MSDEQMYPKLSDEGRAQFEVLIEAAKAEIAKAAENAIGDLYCEMGMWIESDAWGNVRSSIMAGLTNYNQGGDYNNKRIRYAILMENRAEIIKDLNQDMIAEIEQLKESLKREREYTMRGCL